MIYKKTAKRLAGKACEFQKRLFNVEDPVLKKFAETGEYEPQEWFNYLFSIYDLEGRSDDETIKIELESLRKYFLYVAMR